MKKNLSWLSQYGLVEHKQRCAACVYECLVRWHVTHDKDPKLPTDKRFCCLNKLTEVTEEFCDILLLKDQDKERFHGGKQALCVRQGRHKRLGKENGTRVKGD